MTKTDIHDKDDEGTRSVAGANSLVVRPAAAGHAVIPFPISRPTAASAGINGGVTTAVTPPTFEPLGKSVAAVVLRLRSKRPSIKAIVQGHGEVDAPDDL